MASGMQIKEHMEVVGSDGKHVGIVDHLEGKDRIKLAKLDPKAGGRHHFIPRDWVGRVGAHVHLIKTSREAMEQWQTETPAAAPEKAR
jgi:hypothetical protein